MCAAILFATGADTLLTPAEKSLLASAREDGLIPFPQGRAETVERQIKLLYWMEEKGYVRKKRNGRVRGFYLT